MRKIVTSILLFISMEVTAQTGYSVVYDRERWADTSGFPGHTWKNHLVFNDSISFHYFLRGQHPKKNQATYGHRDINHSYFNFIKRGLKGYGTHRPSSRIPKLTIDTTIRYRYFKTNLRKQILNYDCIGMLAVNNKNDSTLVYYTPAIPFPFGPEQYHNLPGLVLEVFDQQINTHIVATKIRRKDIEITLPKGINLIWR